MTPPPPGLPIEVAKGVKRIIAPNPSPMTFWGTNTYLLGETSLVLIDPGPDSDAHFDALTVAIGTTPLACILVTHSHLDHSGLTTRLSDHYGAPVLAFGNSASGRSDTMKRLAVIGDFAGGEGRDEGFSPDIVLHDGDQIDTDRGPLRAIHTPGHMGNHMAFTNGDVIFCGDHVMGWSTSIISPPDGDLGDFLASCQRLKAHGNQAFLPGHGARLDAPLARLDWLITHRTARSAAILDALAHAPQTIPSLTAQIYHDIPTHLLKVAERNVLAHLIHLTEQKKTTHEGDLSLTSTFAIT